jgi:hypothetical protein
MPATSPLQVRLTPADRTLIDDLRRWYRLDSSAAAIRTALAIAHRAGPPRGEPGPAGARAEAEGS